MTYTAKTWKTGQQFTPGDATEMSHEIGLLSNTVGTSTTTLAAPTGVSATDTAAIQAAHDALPASGGNILLQPGQYELTATGVTFTKQVHFSGSGGWGDTAADTGCSVLHTNSTSAQAITITSGGCILENFVIQNGTTATNPTSGWGIKVTNVSFLRIRNVRVRNFYDGIRLEPTGVSYGDAYWRINDCFIQAPVRYGLFTNNVSYPDNGDGTIHGCVFDPRGVTRTSGATSAIRWEGGGGLRVSHTKINGGSSSGQFTTAVDFSIPNFAGDYTSDLFVNNNSIENIGTTGVKFARQAGTGNVWMAQVLNNQFQRPTSGALIDVGAGFINVVVSGNVCRSTATYGVITRTGGGPTTIGENDWDDCVTPVAWESGALSGNISADIGSLATLTSTYTLTSQTAAQKLFNTSTNGRVTLDVGTYFFECAFDLSSMSASSGSFGFDLTAGTATISGIKWTSVGNKAALATAASPQSTTNTAANTAIVTATTNTVGWARINGKVRISAAGTVTPQVSLGVAAAAVVGADSYFRIWKAGSNTVTTLGTWT